MIIEKKHIQTQKEDKIYNLDLSILRKKGNSKTYKGWMIQLMKDLRKDRNFYECALAQVFYKKYIEFETSDNFKALKWKGKSSVEYLEYPDKIIAIRYKKPEPFEQPEEVRVEILKDEVNRVLWAIQSLNSGVWIKSSEIAEKVYSKEWKKVFSNRPEHIKLCEIFNYLEYKGIIDYKRSGKVFLKKK